MAQLPKIPADTAVGDFLTSVLPKVSAEMAASNPTAAELAGSSITMVINVDSESYGYTVTDGSKLDFTVGEIENPMIRIKLSKDDLEKMIKTDNLDMLIGLQHGLNRAKYNALKSLKGSFLSEIAHSDGHVFKIDATLNNAAQPRSTFRMSAADTSALMRKETNPVNLFMSGAMKIEGDMAFAMATQPLFT